MFEGVWWVNFDGRATQQIKAKKEYSLSHIAKINGHYKQWSKYISKSQFKASSERNERISHRQTYSGLDLDQYSGIKASFTLAYLLTSLWLFSHKYVFNKIWIWINIWMQGLNENKNKNKTNRAWVEPSVMILSSSRASSSRVYHYFGSTH